jgi:hypothetical protein
MISICILYRLKDLLKSYGGPEAMPKRPSGSDVASQDRPKKADYLTALIDLLRLQNGNDYQKVTNILRADAEVIVKKKGFGK